MPLLALLVLVLAAAACGTAPPESSAPSGLSGPPAYVPPPKAPQTLPPPPPPLKPWERENLRVPHSASGRYTVVRGEAPARPGRGKVIRYLVEVEDGLPFDPRSFADEVHRTLNDIRGWGRFRRVERPPVRLRVSLSSPRLTDRQCKPKRTGGELSCWNGRRSVINALRWAKGVRQYGDDLDAYRHYLISHEVGHGLGHRHRRCPGPGRLAPVMMQQSKSLGRCRPNPWPFPHRRPGDDTP